MGDDEFVELDESGKPRSDAKPPQEGAAEEARARYEGAGERAQGAPAKSRPRRRRRRRVGRRTVFSELARRGLGMDIKPALVKELRERTGAGMMECKKALVETNGDIDLAAEYLRKAGAAKAGQEVVARCGGGPRSSFAATRRPAAMRVVEVNSETDFVAKDDNFRAFVEKLAEVVAEPAPRERRSVC